MWTIAALSLFPVAYAAQVPAFVPPSLGPTVASSNYVGANNGSLSKPTVVAGKQFDRFIQIWLENTDFATASNSTTFTTLASQGIILDRYYGVTHPSEPNYIASVGGDFWGMADDAFYAIPKNISTIVDLLEAKNISWASYQENMPSDGFTGFNYTSKNYLNTSAPPYTFYVRKHNPLIIFDSVATVSARAALNRNFNDFAADVNASAIPQWVFVTPNLVNDAHDTDINFVSQWLQFWLIPLLTDPRFNDNRTLILITFDENETYTINNRVVSILIGGAVPTQMRGTTDSTYYTHYSTLSTIQANWGLGSLGRGDTNKTLSNVFSLVAQVTGYTNVDVTGDNIPLTNLTGVFPGALNPNQYVPYLAPNITAVGAGGGPVFIGPGLNTSLNSGNAPAPVNLTALNETVPGSGTTSTAPAKPTGTGSGSGSGSGSGAVVGREVAGLTVVLGVLMGSAILFV